MLIRRNAISAPVHILRRINSESMCFAQLNESTHGENIVQSSSFKPSRSLKVLHLSISHNKVINNSTVDVG